MIICGTDWGLTIVLLLVQAAWNLFRFGWILLCAVGLVLLCRKQRRLGAVLLVCAAVWFAAVVAVMAKTT